MYIKGKGGGGGGDKGENRKRKNTHTPDKHTDQAYNANTSSTLNSCPETHRVWRHTGVTGETGNAGGKKRKTRHLGGRAHAQEHGSTSMPVSLPSLRVLDVLRDRRTDEGAQARPPVAPDLLLLVLPDLGGAGRRWVGCPALRDPDLLLPSACFFVPSQRGWLARSQWGMG